jgi:hypothetical protein
MSALRDRLPSIAMMGSGAHGEVLNSHGAPEDFSANPELWAHCFYQTTMPALLAEMSSREKWEEDR